MTLRCVRCVRWRQRREFHLSVIAFVQCHTHSRQDTMDEDDFEDDYLDGLEDDYYPDDYGDYGFDSDYDENEHLVEDTVEQAEQAFLGQFLPQVLAEHGPNLVQQMSQFLLNFGGIPDQDMSESENDDREEDEEEEEEDLDPEVEAKMNLLIEKEEATRPLCRFFALGKCKYAEKCTFRHVNEESSANETKMTCPFYVKGKCRYGDKCRLDHPPASDGKPSAASKIETEAVENELDCGICLDSVVSKNKRYGILTRCSHPFCLDCLKQWRKSKQHASENDDPHNMTRTCPICRKRSDFVVPATKFVVGKEKKAFIAAYRDALGTKKCKYFDGTYGSCTFGKFCFYQHLSPSGSDIKSLDPTIKTRKRRRAVQQQGAALAAHIRATLMAQQSMNTESDTTSET